MAYLLCILTIPLLILGVTFLETALVYALRPSYHRAWPTFPPWMVALLAFFIPGTGQLLNGQILQGLTVMFLFWGVIFFIPLPVQLIALGIYAVPAIVWVTGFLSATYWALLRARAR